jgi:3-deoxy-D-manno-octulosonic-acid transferase
MISEEVRRQQATPTATRSVGSSRLLAVLFDPRLVLWNFLLLTLSPGLLFMKTRRYLKKHAPHEFSLGRLTSQTRLKGDGKRPHIVFVAASYGEVLLVKRLSEALLELRPNLRITWAIRDPKALAEFSSKHREQSITCQPFDSFYPVTKWLSRVNPDALIMMERYNFPNLVASSKIWGAKVFLVNGRAKGAYQTSGGIIRSYYRWVFGSYDSLLFQSDADYEAAQVVAPTNVTTAKTGNIKLDLTATEIAPERAATIRKWLAAERSPIIAAGSTDELEEDIFVLDAFVKARKQQDCRLLLAPRSLDNPASLKKEIQSRGLSVSFRTNMDAPADVHILDTMGELAYAYSLTRSAYVGGSLLGMGHNVVEPLEWGVPVAYGPKRGHFAALQSLCEKSGVGFRIRTSDELSAFWIRALSEPDFLSSIRQKARDMLSLESGALDATVRILAEKIS